MHVSKALKYKALVDIPMKTKQMMDRLNDESPFPPRDNSG